MHEKEVVLSEENVETFLAGRESQSMEGVENLLGTACALLYIRYGLVTCNRFGKGARLSLISKNN